MGKVYEALKKADQAPGVPDVPVFGLESNPDAGAAAKPDNFDFVSYSLSAATTPEIKRANRETAAAQAAAQIARETLTKPAREVAIDQARIDPRLVAFSDFDPRAAEQYNKLAVSLISRAVEQPSKRVLVASAQHGEGRTCVLLNLACALAAAHQRVLVVDSDLYRPSVLRLLGVEAEVGLADALSRNLSPGTAALRVMPHGFTVLPVRERVENSAELLASPSFRQMLDTFDPDFDFMLFDSSPLLATADANLLVRLVDTTLLVVRAGKVNSAQMAKAIAPLTEDSIFGVVLNRFLH